MFFSETLPKKYRKRHCEGSAWKSQFPSASKNEIRSFLVLFTDAFAFEEKDKLKFHPNDKLIDIYRALYPHAWQADAMELETLDDDLQLNYGCLLQEIWHEELTLGEVFSKVRHA